MTEDTSTSNHATLEPITFEQSRVLGCLLEKEMTTPENYPLTLNSLVSACNQSSNREPVVSFDEATVLDALEELKTRGLAFQVSIPGARVQKFKHNLNGKFPRLEKPGLALMCVMLLRGPQTAGELRQRTERMQAFPDIPSVEDFFAGIDRLSRDAAGDAHPCRWRTQGRHLCAPPLRACGVASGGRRFRRLQQPHLNGHRMEAAHRAGTFRIARRGRAIAPKAES